MSQQPEKNDSNLDQAKDAYEDALSPGSDKVLSAPPKPPAPVPNPDEDEQTGIAPEITPSPDDRDRPSSGGGSW